MTEVSRVTDVTAIITTLGRDQERLNKCIKSLLASKNVEPFSVLVILNDPSVSLNLPDEVVLVNPGLNLGNVGGLEYGRSLTNSELIWMIQDDMEVDELCLSVLKERLAAEPDLALISPVLVRNGFVPARSRGGRFTDENATMAYFPLKDCRPPDLTGTSTLDFVACSGGLVRASALEEVGGFNLQLYPLHHGDVALCMNLKEAGLKFDLEIRAHISHKTNGSTPGLLLKTLQRSNQKVIQNKLRGIETEIPIAPDLSPRIINAVAQRSSLLFLEVASVGQSEVNKYEKLLLIKVLRKVRHFFRLLSGKR